MHLFYFICVLIEFGIDTNGQSSNHMAKTAWKQSIAIQSLFILTPFVNGNALLGPLIVSVYLQNRKPEPECTVEVWLRLNFAD